MDKLRILYDGWPLVRQPYSPAAMHLRALLAYLPSQVEAIVALPEPPARLSPGFKFHLQPIPNTETGRLKWEQRSLPRLAAQLGAHLVHTTSLSAPLFGPANSVVSPSDFQASWPGDSPAAAARGSSLAARVRKALSQGGLVRTRAIFWPADVPQPDLPVPMVSLPPVVHPAFTHHLEDIPDLQPTLPRQGQNDPNGYNPGNHREALPIDLPETYLLYHGPADREALLGLLEAWSWAAGPVGTNFPLLLLGLNKEQRRELQELLDEFDFGETVRALVDFPLESVPALYRGCTVLFHPAPLSPWGGPVRQALACGKPVVASESALADAIVGPAAYLAPGHEPRALGAALLTVIVEQDVAEKLEGAARERSADWRNVSFGQQLAEAYEALR